MNLLLFYKDTCVIQLPKSGSNTFFNCHSTLAGSFVPYDLEPNFSIKNYMPISKKKLSFHLREPLDRFFAGLRQDFIDSKQTNLEYFCQTRIDQLLAQKRKNYYEQNCVSHIDEKIVFRIKRILELTNDWWETINIYDATKINKWLEINWNIKNIVKKNSHKKKLRNEIDNLRKKNLEWNEKISNVDFIKEEFELYKHVNKTFTPARLYEILIKLKKKIKTTS